ncbi:MAG: peptidoglycan editing factor PgeF [Hyphomicrobiales bacterium]|nr:MAG: peptidoglycan editing factor PgeF [Hyphomicrobiales bacterium]
MAAPYTVSKALNVPGISHGFFGREGGRSKGDLAANNMSITQGDNPDLVVSNRSSAAFAMGGYDIKDLVVFRQTHSTTVVTLTERPDRTVAIEADAMVTNRPDLLLGILTADCAPVLLADPEAGIIGAAHAGWKGAAGGILQATVMAMVTLGADPKDIRAAIGPTISAANYEVGPDTAAQIAALDSTAAHHVTTPEGKTREHFDIPGLLAEQLFGAGVGTVGDLGLCTYADPARFFSHRYATHQGITTGRQISCIGLR